MNQLYQTTRVHLDHLVVTKQHRLQGNYMIEDFREGLEPVISIKTLSGQTIGDG